MNEWKFRLAVLGLAIAMIACCSACSLAVAEEDEAVVFNAKPWFAPSGGVSKDVLTNGSTWCALTTDEIHVKTVPVSYEESFNDIFSLDKNPVDAKCAAILQVEAHRANELIDNYGQNWYDNNIKSVFREICRAEYCKHPFASLISGREIYDEIKAEISNNLKAYFAQLNGVKPFPVTINTIVCERCSPNNSVMEEINNTSAQIQAQKTWAEKAKAEITRATAERERGKADMAYKNTLGLTEDGFVRLKALDVEVRKVELIREKSNVNVDVLLGAAGNMWDIKQK